MTEQEALKYIRLFREDWDRDSKTKNAMALDVSIKALEKQIAKKPIHVRYKPRTINRMHHHVYCGVCGKYEQRVCMEDNYCRRCGTKIDWGNEDAE